MPSGPTLMPAAVGKEDIFAPPLPSYGIYKGGGKWHCPAPKSTGSPAPPTTGSALVCCVGDMHCWFCQSHDPRASSPTNQGQWGVDEGGGLLSFTHSVYGRWGVQPDPPHTFLGADHLCPGQQGQLSYVAQATCRPHSPEYCSQWGVRSALQPCDPCTSISHLT